MRVGFGLSTVTFRPSRVFHSRVFSRPSVDTAQTNRVAWCCPHFYQTLKMLWQILRADNVLVHFISLLYKQLLPTCTLLKSFIVPSALLTQFPKKFHKKLVASAFIFTKLSTKRLLLWRHRVRLSIKGYCRTRPRRSFCFLSMFKLHCKRHYIRCIRCM